MKVTTLGETTLNSVELKIAIWRYLNETIKEKGAIPLSSKNLILSIRSGAGPIEISSLDIEWKNEIDAL